MADFHKSTMGQIYYGKHIPELIKELRRIADNLEQGNKMMMKETKFNKKFSKKIKDIKELDTLEGKNIKNEGGFSKSDPDLTAIDG